MILLCILVHLAWISDLNRFFRRNLSKTEHEIRDLNFLAFWASLLPKTGRNILLRLTTRGWPLRRHLSACTETKYANFWWECPPQDSKSRLSAGSMTFQIVIEYATYVIYGQSLAWNNLPRINIRPILCPNLTGLSPLLCQTPIRHITAQWCTGPPLSTANYLISTHHRHRGRPLGRCHTLWLDCHLSRICLLWGP